MRYLIIVRDTTSAPADHITFDAADDQDAVREGQRIAAECGYATVGELYKRVGPDVT
jgi:hypothetical protein